MFIVITSPAILCKTSLANKLHRVYFYFSNFNYVESFLFTGITALSVKFCWHTWLACVLHIPYCQYARHLSNSTFSFLNICYCDRKVISNGKQNAWLLVIVRYRYLQNMLLNLPIILSGNSFSITYKSQRQNYSLNYSIYTA